MTHHSSHGTAVVRALAQQDKGHVISARLGAYIAGSDAAEAGIETCPFGADALPELAEQWHRGRAQTLAFQDRRQNRRMDPSRRLASLTRRATATHAAASHPVDD